MKLLEFYHTQTVKGFEIAAKNSALEDDLIRDVLEVCKFVPQLSKEPHPPRIVYRKIKTSSLYMITHCKKIGAYEYFTDKRDGNYMLHGVIVDAKTKFNICEFVLKFPWSSGLSKNDSENFAKNNNLEERQFNVDIEYKANDDLDTFLVSLNTRRNAFIYLLKLILERNNKYIYIKSPVSESGMWILSAYYLLPEFYTKELNFAINTLNLQEAFNLMEVHDRDLLPNNCNVETLNFNITYDIDNFYLLQYIDEKIKKNEISHIVDFNNLLLELDYYEDPSRLCEILFDSRSSFNDIIQIINFQTSLSKKTILLKYIIQSKLRNLEELFLEHFKITPSIIKEYLTICNDEETKTIIDSLCNVSHENKIYLINNNDEIYSSVFSNDEFWNDSFLNYIFETTICSNDININEMKRILFYLKKIISPKGYIKQYIRRFEHIEKSETSGKKSELKDLFQNIVENDFKELEIDKKEEAMAILLSRVIKKVWLAADWNWLYNLLYERDKISYWNVLRYFLENYRKKNESYHDKNWLIDKLIESYSDKQSMLNVLHENLRLSYEDRGRINYNLREMALPEIKFE